MLPMFLAAAQGAYDELCVVDTGSTDATCALLLAAQARLTHAPWREDFAAARNLSLAQAQGDWILVLDADEMLTPQAVAEVRAVAAEPTLGAATLRICSDLAHGHRTQASLLRMFRRDPSIRFEHAIHEDVLGTVRPYLEASGQKLVHLQGEVTHLGYTRARAEDRDKKTRDLTILRRLVAADPNDLYSWFKILELARFWRDPALAKSVAAPATAALQRTDAARLRRGHYVGELLVLLAAAQQGDDAQANLAWLQPWAPAICPSAAYHLRCGELLEQTGQLPAAASAFTRCTELAGHTANVQLAQVRPHLGLARLDLMQRQPVAALERVGSVLHLAPRDPEALLALLSIGWALGGEQAALGLAQAHRADYGDTPELSAAEMEAAALGRTAQAAADLAGRG